MVLINPTPQPHPNQVLRSSDDMTLASAISRDHDSRGARRGGDARASSALKRDDLLATKSPQSALRVQAVGPSSPEQRTANWRRYVKEPYRKKRALFQPKRDLVIPSGMQESPASPGRGKQAPWDGKRALFQSKRDLLTTSPAHWRGPKQ